MKAHGKSIKSPLPLMLLTLVSLSAAAYVDPFAGRFFDTTGFRETPSGHPVMTGQSLDADGYSVGNLGIDVGQDGIPGPRAFAPCPGFEH